MNETSIYVDSSSNYTFAKTVHKRVPDTTSGNERTRISAAYSSSAFGLKLPIYLILPRKTEIPDFELHENCTLFILFVLLKN